MARWRDNMVWDFVRSRKGCAGSAVRGARSCGTESDETIQDMVSAFCIASPSLSSVAHSRDPLARNDDPLS